MALYAEDAVVENHPLDSSSPATGVEEIRGYEIQIPSIQGTTGGIEFIDLAVAGNTVKFKHIFFNEDRECFSGGVSEVSVEDDKITRYVWGVDDGYNGDCPL